MPYVIASSPAPRYFKHIGPYAYRMGFLLEFTRMERGELERAESLEQLRALENGYRIKIVETQYRFPGSGYAGRFGESTEAAVER